MCIRDRPLHRAVCPAWHGGGFGEAEQLAGAYHSALELAAEYHCESVAFPLLSSGNYGYPKEQAFRIAVDTITQYVMAVSYTHLMFTIFSGFFWRLRTAGRSAI